MLKRPTPDTGAFIKLHTLLESKKSKRKLKFAVVVFGLLENAQDDIHGIFWICDIFSVHDEAKILVDEIITKTGITHVKILEIGESDLLSNNIDPTKARFVDIQNIEKQNIKESIKDKEDQTRINKIIEEENYALTNKESPVYYGHIWVKYIQNRMIREQTQKSVEEYLKVENQRKEELIILNRLHPKNEESWLPIFCKYREELDENSASRQIKDLWLTYRKDVFPDLY